jgi:hypothetical protein
MRREERAARRNGPINTAGDDAPRGTSGEEERPNSTQPVTMRREERAARRNGPINTGA